ncbi:MAG: murein hydrolase activator EnvC family protein [Parvularcula sp.]
MRLVFILFLTMVFALPARAQEDPSTTEAARLRQIEAQMEANRRAAEALRQKQEAEEKAADNLRTRLIEIADGLQEAEARANAIDRTLARLTQEEADAVVQLARRQRSVSDVLAALQSLERSRPPALAVSPEDATKAAIAAAALAGITPELRDQVDALKASLAAIAEVRVQQKDEQAKLARAEAALEERRRLLENALQERVASQAKNKERLRNIAAEDAALAREATNLRDLIYRLNQRQKSAEPTLAPLSPLTSGPEIYRRLPRRFSQAAGVLPWPASGRMVVTYGAPMAGGKKSDDVTLVTRPGAVVTAPFRGEVAFADDFGRLGRVVILNAGEDFRLILIGMSRLDVIRGERVRAGEPLGRMATGREGRLRFQIRKDNTPVNPLRWLTPPAKASANP